MKTHYIPFSIKKKRKSHYSILLYPITLEGRRGTTDCLDPLAADLGLFSVIFFFFLHTMKKITLNNPKSAAKGFFS